MSTPAANAAAPAAGAAAPQPAQHQRPRQGSQVAGRNTADEELHVAYVTSTSVFVPDVAGTSTRTPTLLDSLTSEQFHDVSLSQIVGATTAASGNGLLLHVYRCVPNPATAAELVSTRRGPVAPPPLLCVLDEEEALTRATTDRCDTQRLQARAAAARRVTLLRFTPEERDRFLQAAACSDQTAAVIARQLVAACVELDASGAEVGVKPQLAAVAGVLVGQLPQVRASRLDEAAGAVMKVIFR